MSAGTRIIFGCPVAPWLVGAAALCFLAAVFLFARSDTRHLKPGLRAALLALALVAGVFLTGLALDPTLIRSWPDPHKPRCVVLVDASRSMLLEDMAPGGGAEWVRPGEDGADAERRDKVSREDVVRFVLTESPQSWLARVKEGFEVAGYRFSSEVERLPLGQGAAPFKVDPEGFSTALGDAIEEAATGAESSRPRAVILLSDGAWNAGQSPSEVARVLGRLGTPVFVVGVGDPEPPCDVAVTSLRGPKKALLGDELFLTARIAVTGVGSRPLRIELVTDNEVVAQKQFFPPPSGGEMNVNLSHIPQRPGSYRYTVRVAAQEGEKDTSNNSASEIVDVMESKIKVLFVESEPRWEYRFIRNVFERDPAVELNVCLLRPKVGPIEGQHYIAALPDKKRLSSYDVVIVGDVARDSLPDEFLEGTAQLVRERSGALIVLAGRRSHYRTLSGTPVGEILPVTVTGGGAGYRKTGSPFQAELTPEGASHLVTRLSQDEEENESIWSAMPSMRWSATVGSLRRGAEALLVHPYRLAGTRKLPLIAVHRVGSGKVMFCGVEGTWRWRRGVGDKYHYRFWAQAVRWMAKKQFTEGDPRARLDLDRTECATGDAVEVQVYCLGPDGYPLDKGRVGLQIKRPDGETLRLVMEPAPGGWGIYRAKFTPTGPGTYEMRPIVAIYGEQPLPSVASLTVVCPDLEKRFLAQDRNALKAIAEASGGRYLEIGQVNELPSLLEARVERRMLTAEYAPFRHWAYYVLLSCILGVAWFARKRSGLA